MTFAKSSSVLCPWTNRRHDKKETFFAEDLRKVCLSLQKGNQDKTNLFSICIIFWSTTDKGLVNLPFLNIRRRRNRSSQ